MKAVAIEKFGGPEQVKTLDLPIPQPKPTEVLIKIHYAAVNPVDWKVCEGWLKNMFPYEFPLILGWDASGTIEAVGEAVQEFHEGDEVYAYCRKPVINLGTFAEYIAVEETHAALKPKNISFAEAAAMPLVGLTAWQSLFDFAGLKENQTTLIHAGAGGVGSVAIQLAKHVNARVLTTASEKNREYVMDLGADIFIDYTKEDFVSRSRDLFPDGIDCVCDCVGGETLEKSWNCVRQGGCLVTIVDLKIDRSRGDEMGIHAGSVFVVPNGQQLKMLAELIEGGSVRPPAIHEYDLSDAVTALEQNRKGHTRGKIVLKII